MNNKIEQLKNAFLHLSSIETVSERHQFWLKQYNILLIQLKRPRNSGTNKEFDRVVDQLMDEYEKIK